jgi:hypothetical protein
MRLPLAASFKWGYLPLRRLRLSFSDNAAFRLQLWRNRASEPLPQCRQQGFSRAELRLPVVRRQHPRDNLDLGL